MCPTPTHPTPLFFCHPYPHTHSLLPPRSGDSITAHEQPPAENLSAAPPNTAQSCAQPQSSRAIAYRAVATGGNVCVVVCCWNCQRMVSLLAPHRTAPCGLGPAHTNWCIVPTLFIPHKYVYMCTIDRGNALQFYSNIT